MLSLLESHRFLHANDYGAWFKSWSAFIKHKNVWHFIQTRRNSLQNNQTIHDLRYLIAGVAILFSNYCQKQSKKKEKKPKQHKYMLFTLVIKHSHWTRQAFSEYVHVPLWRDGWRYVAKIALSSRGMLLFPTLISQCRGWATPPSKITQNSANIFVTYYVLWANIHGCLFQDSAMCKSFASAP